jgi:hypothetical protein
MDDKRDTKNSSGPSKPAPGADSKGNEAPKTSYRYAHADRKKRRFLKALQNNMGIVKYACMDISISRQTFYRWKEEDPEFRKLVEMIDEDQKDYVEKKLLNQIRSDVTPAILFYAETKMKDRGYYRKMVNDTTIRTDEPFKVTMNL